MSVQLETHDCICTGAMDPRCKLCIFMGKTNPGGPVHRQQSMIVVPMDSPGITIVRPLSVFGYLDAPRKWNHFNLNVLVSRDEMVACFPHW